MPSRRGHPQLRIAGYFGRRKWGIQWGLKSKVKGALMPVLSRLLYYSNWTTWLIYLTYFILLFLHIFLNGDLQLTIHICKKTFK